PGVGGDVPAELVGARRACARRRLNPPELKLGPHGNGCGIPPPVPVDHPVLLHREDRVQPLPPREPDGAPVFSHLNLNGLAVHPAHTQPCTSARKTTGLPRGVTHPARPAWRKTGNNQIFARPGELNDKIEYKFNRTYRQDPPVTLATHPS